MKCQKKCDYQHIFKTYKSKSYFANPSVVHFDFKFCFPPAVFIPRFYMTMFTLLLSHSPSYSCLSCGRPHSPTPKKFWGKGINFAPSQDFTAAS